jgi:hypothetical protein
MSDMTGMPDVPLPDESHGTYPEGWPKKVSRSHAFGPSDPEFSISGEVEVVPLSDAERLREERDEAIANCRDLGMIGESSREEAERLREALEFIAYPDHDWRPEPLDLNWAVEIARAALDREGEHGEWVKCCTGIGVSCDREGEE